MAGIEKPRIRVRVGDGFANVVAQLGTSRDKASSGSWFHAPTAPTEIDALYRGSWLGRKIIDIPASDMTREWRTFQTDGDVVQKIEAEEKRLQLRRKIATALRWARLYGGAAIVIGDGAQDPSQPLADGAQVRFLHVLARHQISAGPINLDPMSEAYGLPETWTLAGSQTLTEVHRSRVIPVIGAERPPTMGFTDPWGDSAYDAMRDALMNSSTASSVIASLLTEAKVDVVEIEDLDSYLASDDGEKRLMQRFALAALLKSINGMLVLGGNEKWQQKTLNFAGLPEVHARLLQEVSGAADIPLTRLLGQSPGGLQSTGESDLRNYYDGISSKQEDILRPVLERLDALLVPAVTGKPASAFWWEFGELWQLSEKDQSEVFARTAGAIKTIADAGLVPDAALSKSAVALLDGEGMLPGLAGAVEKATGGPDDAMGGEDDEEAGDDADGADGRFGDGYNPDQPREPAGSPEGGQWTAMGPTAKTLAEIEQARARHLAQAQELENQFFAEFSREKFELRTDATASGGSVYMLLLRHDLKKDGTRKVRSFGARLLKIRFADHPQYYGAGVSIDTYSGNTLSDALAVMRYKADPKAYPKPVVGEARIDPGSGLWKFEGRKPYWDFAALNLDG